MASYTALTSLSYTWSDSNFTYSLDANNATYHLTSYTVHNPENGDSAIADAALTAWSNVANITFAVDNSNPEIGIYEAEFTTALGDAGPASGRTYGVGITDVDVFINNGEFFFFAADEKLWTYQHEIGHALGLRHPNGDADDPNYNIGTTIMSYNDFQFEGQALPSVYAVTPMIYDIAAIQSKYGANTGYRTFDDLYTLDGTKKAWTIWDADGEDTLRVSPNETRDAVLDLRGGINEETGEPYWSHMGDEYVAIALDSNQNWEKAIIIENAPAG